MKKVIAQRLCVVILISMVFIALIGYYFQLVTAQDSMHSNFLLRINQIEQILENNDKDIERLKENLKEDYFIRAKAAAYIIQSHPDIAGDLDELKKVASLLQIDEIHLFDKEGTLFSGTEPIYYNYTFRSGSQMEFFLPMLDDYSLQLCQEVLPNTAEQKLMQYVAVWQEDHQQIIQIGMEPVRLLDAMQKNELSHIFSMLTADEDITFFAADSSTGEILGATNKSLMGKDIKEFGINLSDVQEENAEEKWDIHIDGVKNYCVIQPAGNVIVGVSSSYQNLYEDIPYNMMLIIAGLLVLSAAIVLLILMMLDRDIIHQIDGLVNDMDKIAAGDLDHRVEAAKLPELAELSNNINHMVTSLLETTGKLSLVFQNVDIPIAVYELNTDMKRVLATNKIGEILNIPENEMKQLLADRVLFIEKIEQVCRRPFEEDTYIIGEANVDYVKIKSYEENGRTLGIIVSVTEEMVEKQQIKLERDVDLLTGLSSRRAFFNEMNRLFQHPEELKLTALLMADTDNLKYVNDTWGHEYGDRLLAETANLFSGSEAPDKLAARLSGDEFVVFLYNADSEEVLQKYIDVLYQKMLGTSIKISEQATVPVRVSCGYIIFNAERADYHEMLRLADQTMYQVKKGDKGRFMRSDPLSYGQKDR